MKGKLEVEGRELIFEVDYRRPRREGQRSRSQIKGAGREDSRVERGEDQVREAAVRRRRWKTRRRRRRGAGFEVEEGAGAVKLKI